MLDERRGLGPRTMADRCLLLSVCTIVVQGGVGYVAELRAKTKKQDELRRITDCVKASIEQRYKVYALGRGGVHPRQHVLSSQSCEG